MSEERPRRDDGTFEKTVTKQAILKALDSAEAPIMTAKEIANGLDASNVVVGERLNEMHDSGLVGRKKREPVLLHGGLRSNLAPTTSMSRGWKHPTSVG